MADAASDMKEVEAPAEVPGPTCLDTLNANLVLIRKAVATRETRLLVGRCLRQTATARSQFTPELLEDFFSKTLAEASPVRGLILHAVKGTAPVRCLTRAGHK